MANTPEAATPEATIRGKIIEAEVSLSQNAVNPLPLACGLYAIEDAKGVWLCAYYGSNRSNFDFLPQKDASVDEDKLGIAFQSREFIPRDRYKPEVWEEFKKARFRTLASH